MSLFTTKDTDEIREERLEIFHEEVESIMYRLKEDNVGTLPVLYLINYFLTEFHWSPHVTMKIIEDLVKLDELKSYSIQVVELPGKKVAKKPKIKTVTPDQHAVLATVRYWDQVERDPLTAKEIGIENHRSEKMAAKWARGHLRALKARGLVRAENGKYYFIRHYRNQVD